MVAALALGGVIQGLGLADAKVPFIAITDLLKPLLLEQSGVGALGDARRATSALRPPGC